MIRSLGILLLCCGVVLAETPTPTSLYLVTFSRSDSLGDWADYILDLRPTDGEVLVRSVRIGPPNSFCSTPVIVKAHEKRIKREVYEDLLANANPCEINLKTVQRAMRKRGPVDLMEHPTDVKLVAQCGGETRVLDLPYLARGKRPRNATVAKLRDLYWDIHEKVFPADISFRPSNSDDDYTLQQAAQQFVSELQAGEFDEGGGWKYVSERYRGPVRDGRVVTPILQPSQLNFVTYTAPDYPPLALSARIQGLVRLTLNFGRDGSVTEAHLVEGPPILGAAAMKAAPLWRVDPLDVPPQQVEVAVMFEMECGD